MKYLSLFSCLALSSSLMMVCMEEERKERVTYISSLKTENSAKEEIYGEILEKIGSYECTLARSLKSFLKQKIKELQLPSNENNSESIQGQWEYK